MKYPQFSADVADLTETQPDLTVVVTNQDGKFNIPDIRKINILNRRMIVSRKRTRNLFDLTNLWKKIVLSNMDEEVLQDNMDVPVEEVNEDVDMELDSNDDDSASDNSGDDPFVTSFNQFGL